MIRLPFCLSKFLLSMNECSFNAIGATFFSVKYHTYTGEVSSMDSMLSGLLEALLTGIYERELIGKHTYDSVKERISSKRAPPQLAQNSVTRRPAPLPDFPEPLYGGSVGEPRPGRRTAPAAVSPSMKGGG